MATTTNFGWETPDDTDLVKDGAAAIRTALGGVDTSFVDLKGGTTGQVLSKATNTDLDFTWVAQDDSNAIQNAIVDAKGDLITATANDTPARLAVGTNGQTLVADSSTATGLKWATPAGGGKVLQVVSATTTTPTTIASTTLTDTGLSLSITPTLSTSKILVLITQTGFWQRNESTQAVGMVIQRAGSTVYDMNDNGYGVAGFANTGSTSIDAIFTMAASYLDSPATTSATTYKTQARVLATTNSGQVVMQRNSKPSTITLLEIGA